MIFSLLCGIISILGDHLGVMMLDYALFCLFIFISLFKLKGKLVVPRSYLIILTIYIIVLTINAYISPYTMGLKYVAIGAISTMMPFILYITSYNYLLTDSQLSKLIDAWIHFVLFMCGIAIMETLFFPSSYTIESSILKISIIKHGFFASICNQGVILSLYQFASKHNLKYRNIAIALTIAAVLTVQLKVIIGLLLIWMLYALTMSENKQRSKVFILMFSLAIFAIPVIINIPALASKIDKYINLYGGENAYENVARPALYYQAIKIANDFCPLGSGQGTFGSIPVNMVYNPIYYDYGLSEIHGLGETGDNFKMDTHWSNILGENGYLGTLLYLMLFCYPLRYLKKMRNLTHHQSTKFLFIAVIIVVMFESLTLCIPGRMAFMFIYAGILSILCRKISTTQL